MPEIVVKHNVRDASAPVREVIPSGNYHVVILKAAPKLTKENLSALSIEFSVLKTAKESIVNDEEDSKYFGRSIFQDYVLEPQANLFNTQRSAFRIQQLMAATGCPHKVMENGNIGFNTDHLLTRTVVVTVVQNSGKADPADPMKPVPLYNNVDRIDSTADPEGEDMI